MVDYVVGFAFSADREHIVLIQKRRPSWQVGLLNGVGGKIEENEKPLDAMEREFLEETSVSGLNWIHIASLYSPSVEVYAAFDVPIEYVTTMTDEIVVVVKLSSLANRRTLPGVPLLIAIALDNSVMKPVSMILDQCRFCI